MGERVTYERDEANEKVFIIDHEAGSIAMIDDWFPVPRQPDPQPVYGSQIVAEHIWREDDIFEPIELPIEGGQ